MHLKFLVSAVKHTISIGNMDLCSRYMWPEPKLCHAMAWKWGISSPAKLCFVFFGKAVSVQLCKLKMHHWCNCARLLQSHWICFASVMDHPQSLKMFLWMTLSPSSPQVKLAQNRNCKAEGKGQRQTQIRAIWCCKRKSLWRLPGLFKGDGKWLRIKT